MRVPRVLALSGAVASDLSRRSFSFLSSRVAVVAVSFFAELGCFSELCLSASLASSNCQIKCPSWPCTTYGCAHCQQDQQTGSATMLCKYVVVWDSDTSMMVQLTWRLTVSRTRCTTCQDCGGKQCVLLSQHFLRTASIKHLNRLRFQRHALLAVGARMHSKPLAYCGVHNWQPSWSPNSNPQAGQGMPCPSRKTENSRSTKAINKSEHAKKDGQKTMNTQGQSKRASRKCLRKNPTCKIQHILDTAAELFVLNLLDLRDQQTIFAP